MAYRVTAPLVLVRDEQGRIHHRYEGAVVEIDADHASYLLTHGMVVAIGLDTRIEADVEVSNGDPDADLPRPPLVAAKSQWVDYAVAQGFDRDEAEGMTKQQLVATLS